MILYFNHQHFDHPVIRECLIENCGEQYYSRLTDLVKYDCAAPPTYNRKGKNDLQIRTELVDLPGFAMPDVDRNYRQTWQEITDQRCMQFRNTCFDRPWTVMWSGGIDSTTIVAALIKNLPKADFDNITIACTVTSIWENPSFYFNYIKPNFKVVDSSDMLSQSFAEQNNYVFDGDPADQLFGGLGVSLSTVYQNTELLHKDMVKYPRAAIDFFSKNTNKQFAEWYYHNLIDSAQDAGVNLTTLADFAWWSAFNRSWITVKFRCLYNGAWGTVKNAKFYIDRFVHWYDSNDYQQWAMVNQNTNEKLGSSVADYKLAAKKYIYDVDKNKYYLNFKTKTTSSDIFDLEPAPWCCVTNNWDMLNIHEHADQIVSMLPHHFISD
jgi:hypothetical protein